MKTIVNEDIYLEKLRGDLKKAEDDRKDMPTECDTMAAERDAMATEQNAIATERDTMITMLQKLKDQTLNRMNQLTSVSTKTMLGLLKSYNPNLDTSVVMEGLIV